jgi:transposase-like protein
MARTSEFDEKKHDVLKQINGAGAETPTVRELADRFGVAPATMHSWLRKLGPEPGEELVAWEPGRHRSLRLTRKGSRLLSSLAKQSA